MLNSINVLVVVTSGRLAEFAGIDSLEICWVGDAAQIWCNSNNRACVGWFSMCNRIFGSGGVRHTYRIVHAGNGSILLGVLQRLLDTSLLRS